MNTARFLKYVWPFFNIMQYRGLTITDGKTGEIISKAYQDKQTKSKKKIAKHYGE